MKCTLSDAEVDAIANKVFGEHDNRSRELIAQAIGDAIAELEKLRAFWEWSRLADRHRFESDYAMQKEWK